jgi:hypothetical protein
MIAHISPVRAADTSYAAGRVPRERDPPISDTPAERIQNLELALSQRGTGQLLLRQICGRIPRGGRGSGPARDVPQVGAAVLVAGGQGDPLAERDGVYRGAPRAGQGGRTAAATACPDRERRLAHDCQVRHWRCQMRGTVNHGSFCRIENSGGGRGLVSFRRQGRGPGPASGFGRGPGGGRRSGRRSPRCPRTA